MTYLTGSRPPGRNIFTDGGYDQGSLIYGLNGYTAVSSSPPQPSCTLVTLKHAITSGHMSVSSLTFVGKSGTAYPRQVVSSQLFGTDCKLLTLDQDLPADDFDVARIFPSDVDQKLQAGLRRWWERNGCLARYVPCIASDQMKAAFTMDLWWLQRSQFSYDAFGYYDPSVWFPAHTHESAPAFGDSGSGLFMSVGNDLVLFGVIESQYARDFPDVALQSGGALRNDVSGWVGFKFTVGSNPLIVSHLYRWVVSGNSGQHVVKITDANGNDVPNASVTMCLNSQEAMPGTFYDGGISLVPAPTLDAGATYYLVSHETAGGDKWYDCGACPLTVSLDAGSCLGAASSTDGDPKNFSTSNGSWTYGPLKFDYAWGGQIVRVNAADVDPLLPAPYQTTKADLSTYPDVQ
jgi:hypothetical protein